MAVRPESPLKRRVRDRAGDRCEYCLLPQSLSRVTFHLEHTTARKHGGGDGFENLALACERCNTLKGSDLCGLDPENGRAVRLYDPRDDERGAHFRQVGGRLSGLTPTGRATILLLDLNELQREGVRQLLGETFGADGKGDAR